jgi:type II secretory pathway predicted ATPase ExeA
MYEQFFGLRERPFDLTPNPRFLVMTDGHREALSNLEYAIDSRKGVTLLLGEAGSGKTTVIRAAVEQATSRVHCVHLHNPALTRNEFVEMLAARFELSDEARRSKTALLLEIESLLQKRYETREATVLIVDEAQSLSTELLEEIRLLANIETNDEKLLTLVIAGQPELGSKLDDPSLRQLKQRIALRCELRPLTLHETLVYLAGRIRAAGGVTSRIFTREAATLLHQTAAGIPRTINVLADNALLAAFARQQSPVTSQIVTEIVQDFRIDSGNGSGTANQDNTLLLGTEPMTPANGTTTVAGTPVGASSTTVADKKDQHGKSLFASFAGKTRRFAFPGRKGVA